MNLKIRLMQCGKKQIDVVQKLNEQGINVTQAELSLYINGRVNPPKSELVLAEAEKIIEEWEAEKNAKA